TLIASVAGEWEAFQKATRVAAAKDAVASLPISPGIVAPAATAARRAVLTRGLRNRLGALKAEEAAIRGDISLCRREVCGLVGSKSPDDGARWVGNLRLLTVESDHAFLAEELTQFDPALAAIEAAPTGRIAKTMLKRISRTWPGGPDCEVRWAWPSGQTSSI